MGELDVALAVVPYHYRHVVGVCVVWQQAALSLAHVPNEF